MVWLGAVQMKTLLQNFCMVPLVLFSILKMKFWIFLEF